MPSLRSQFEPALTAALQRALEHLGTLAERPVAAQTTLAELRRRLDKPLQPESLAPEKVIEELAQDAAGGVLGSAGGRFFAWVVGGSLPAALAADWLASAWDQNAALYATGPSAAVAEEVAGKWLKDLLRLPPESSFAFVTGCQMAHVTCLAAARHALLAEHGWDVERRGLFGAPKIRLVCNERRHASVERAVRLLGLGLDQITDVAVDAEDRVIPEALSEMLAQDTSAPTIVALQAGDLNTGSYDDFASLIPIARRHRAWVHVDGAFGLWATASPRYRHFLDGCAEADSWATDGHKWLNVPFDSGYAFVARAVAHRDALSLRASYLTHDAVARDQIDWNPEWSRRARGFATYAALRQLGRDGLAAMIEGCCEHASDIVDGIGGLPGVEILAHPIINQGLVRFLAPGAGASETDHDRYTDEMIARIQAQGGAFFGGTTWRGRRAMRVSVCNWTTSDADVQVTVQTVARALLSKQNESEEGKDDPCSRSA